MISETITWLTTGLAVIDRGTGRELVERELSKDEYSATDLTPLEQLGQWLGNLWDAIIAGALRGNSPWLLLLVAVAIAVIIALIVWRVRRVGLTRTRIPLSAFDPVVSSPEPGPWRDSARAAAERGDLRTAVIDESRAIFALLSLKHVVTLDSASTASELARTAGTELPDYAEALARVATVFNDLLFGEDADRELGPTYAEFLALDESLSTLPARHRAAVAP